MRDNQIQTDRKPASNPLTQAVGLIATIVAVAGVAVNNYRLWWCFGLWMVSNSLSMWLHLRAGLWSLAIRDVIFFALCWHGLWLWTRG